MIDDWRGSRGSFEPWRGEQTEELSFGDPDAWRGDVHPQSGVTPWESADSASEWPVWDAGPEYHMWKRLADGGS